MSNFRRYYFPALYGLITYFSIRLLLDTVTGMKFWERTLGLNIIEISASIFFGYLLIGAHHYLYRYFDKHWAEMDYRQRVWKEPGVITLMTVLFQNIFMLPMAAFTDDGAQWYDVADINVIPLLYSLIYYGISRSNTFLQAYVNNKVKLQEVMNNQLQAELKFLKSQLHPHFLFNALNTIYFQMDEDVNAAKKSVEQFSELLRYQLYDQQQTVSIRHEIQYLHSFINLQKVRASDKLVLNLHLDPDLYDQQVYPLLLFPLVENAFKYVGGEYWINIHASLEQKRILFSVENAIPKIRMPAKAGGIGLENLKRRLELLYPGKHTFEINKTERTFSVALSIETEPVVYQTIITEADEDQMRHHG
ncbi:histidine kinase [Chitinophaga filiformis]|uniref:sensor histidine kinase n=1 Tax=Chitinophaga filiformis TaxID=104663 RepID=UPI001F193EC9|nr:histidine kinase [Chitinophaga filiformis]MCF6407625.1 histidine kinase [Chitinophaga filiformis]MCF6407670.1 histidine kinase [Chitinophaga filiformis]